jgi:hypothetical protein
VGPDVGPEVGLLVGPDVGLEVGPDVGPDVGQLVWPMVGSDVGSLVWPDVLQQQQPIRSSKGKRSRKNNHQIISPSMSPASCTHVLPSTLNTLVCLALLPLPSLNTEPIATTEPVFDRETEILD